MLNTFSLLVLKWSALKMSDCDTNYKNMAASIMLNALSPYPTLT